MATSYLVKTFVLQGSPSGKVQHMWKTQVAKTAAACVAVQLDLFNWGAAFSGCHQSTMCNVRNNGKLSESQTFDNWL